MDADFVIEVIRTKLPLTVGGASAFSGGVHYIFINTDVSEELQKIALEKETQRTKE